MNNDNNLIKKQICSKKEYPLNYQDEVIKAINTITDKTYPFVTFGSSIYKDLLYSGDIDLYQMVDVKHIPKMMQNSIKKIKKMDYIIGDIKVGINPFFIALEYLMGRLSNCKVVDYQPDKMLEFIKKLEQQGIQLEKQLSIVPKNKITLKLWIKLYKEVHDLTTLRWTADEILDGKKKLLKNKIISLEESVEPYEVEIDNRIRIKISLNKIDMYIWINNKYLEMTNVFFDKDSQEFNIDDIKLNMLSYLLSDPPNYNKALKRAYSIARLLDDPIIEILHPFLNSNYNLLYSATTDMDVLKTILELGNTLTVDKRQKFRITLDTIINRLSYYYRTNIDEFIEDIKALKKKYFQLKKSTIIKNLDMLIKKLRNIVNNAAGEYLENNRINLFQHFCP